MAVQEIERKAAEGSAGIERSINVAAVGMVMDIVQAQQYQKPVPSTVRELTANAVDSQSEKEKAIKILNGTAVPEDYFIKREGALYEDSKWNPDYYDVNHLDLENNEIHLSYKEGTGTGRCDKFIIKDFGVGIGARRLKGVLEVGYSTKRNRKDALGAFGLGAKVGLATGADYYKMTTVYNGIKYQVKIFNKKVNSLVGKLNLTTGKKNLPYEFKNEKGVVTGVIYGEETQEKNYTEIEVPCLKHHRYEFETAVKTQLLFFKNVKFCRINEYNEKYDIDFKAYVLHNSPNLIIAKDTPYSKPFVVITNGGNDVGVCYGHIDFKELEIEEMRGAVGIKCQIRQTYDDPDTGEEVLVSPGVDVVASREAIRWTPATREFLMGKFEEAQNEATGLVQEKLQESDFLKWLSQCKNISSMSGNDTAIGRLSRIVELKNLKPKFSGNKNLKFHPMPIKLLGSGFTVETNTKVFDTKDGKKFKTEKNDMDGWAYYDHEAFYIREDQNKSRIKDVYLADMHDGKFIMLNVKSKEQLLSFAEKLAEHDIKNGKVKGSDFKESETKHFKKMLLHQKEVLEAIKSSEHYKSYDDIEVPEDFKLELGTKESKLTEEEKTSLMTNAERRTLEERVVASTYVEKYFSYSSQHEETFKKSKVEPKFKEIKEYEGDLYYGFQVDESKLQYAATILRRPMGSSKRTSLPSGSRDQHEFYNNEKQLLSISKSNKKHFANHNHIDDFFGKQVLIKDKTVFNKVTGIHILMDNVVVKWNTARIIKSRMGNLSFFRNFEEIDKEITDLYNEVNTYVNANYEDTTRYQQRTGFNQHHDEFIKFLDNLQTFQEEVEKDPSNTLEIANKAKELALPGGTTGGVSVDTEMLEKLEKVLLYAKPVRELFNHIDILCLSGDYVSSGKRSIDFELSMFIKEILDLKGVKHE